MWKQSAALLKAPEDWDCFARWHWQDQDEGPCGRSAHEANFQPRTWSPSEGICRKLLGDLQREGVCAGPSQGGQGLAHTPSVPWLGGQHVCAQWLFLLVYKGR